MNFRLHIGTLHSHGVRRCAQMGTSKSGCYHFNDHEHIAHWSASYVLGHNKIIMMLGIIYTCSPLEYDPAPTDQDKMHLPHLEQAYKRVECPWPETDLPDCPSKSYFRNRLNYY